jgi:hypothetical protein
MVKRGKKRVAQERKRSWQLSNSIYSSYHCILRAIASFLPFKSKKVFKAKINDKIHELSAMAVGNYGFGSSALLGHVWSETFEKDDAQISRSWSSPPRLFQSLWSPRDRESRAFP